MGKYRAYCFDGNGLLWIDDRITAETDEDAIMATATIEKAVKIELRQDARVVTIVDRQAGWH